MTWPPYRNYISVCLPVIAKYARLLESHLGRRPRATYCEVLLLLNFSFLRDHDPCDSSIVETHAFQGLYFTFRQWLHWCCGKHPPREALLSPVLQGHRV